MPAIQYHEFAIIYQNLMDCNPPMERGEEALGGLCPSIEGG